MIFTKLRLVTQNFDWHERLHSLREIAKECNCIFFEIYSVQPVEEELETTAFGCLITVHISYNDEKQWPVTRGRVHLTDASQLEEGLESLSSFADFWGLASWHGAKVVPVFAGRSPSLSVGVETLERAEQLYSAYQELPDDRRDLVKRALFWYGQASGNTSPFVQFTALWNVVEILSGTPRPQMRKDGVDGLNEYVKQKLKKGRLKPGHIKECYYKFVHVGIREQVSDALRRLFPEDRAEQWIDECFDYHFDEETHIPEYSFYELRNQLNHGAIAQDNEEDHTKIEWRLVDLRHLAYNMLEAILSGK
jgi:hypothetical protein